MTVKEKNRRLILSTAKKMFIENGFKDSSISDLAIIANIGRRTVYRHFENKDLLLIAVLNEYFSMFVDELKKIKYQETDNSYQRIEYTLDVYEQFFLENKEMLYLMSMLDLNIDQSSRDTDIYKEFIDLVGYPDQVIYNLLEQGKTDQSIKESIDSSLVALTLNNALLSLASRVINHQDTLDSEQGIESWKMVEMLSTVLLQGIKND